MAIGQTRKHFRIPTIGLRLQIDMRDLGGHIGPPGSKLDLAPMKKAYVPGSHKDYPSLGLAPGKYVMKNYK